MDYLKLLQLEFPDCLLALFLFLALGIDYGFCKMKELTLRHRIACGMVSLGLLCAMAGVSFQTIYFHRDHYAAGQIVFHLPQLTLKFFLFALAFLIVQLSARQSMGAHVSEYYVLIGLATLGMSFLVTSRNLLMFFVALELMSLSLYALTAFDKTRKTSAEAGLKYFAFGSVASAFLLFGLSYIYGASHSLSFFTISRNYYLLTHPSPLFMTGWLLVLVGLGFKIAASPFHFWAPDAYEGAPTMVAAWIATGSKVASFFILIEFLRPVIDYAQLQKWWSGALGSMAVLSLLIGNLGALRQRNLKRLLAYSSIGHTGYLLAALATVSKEGAAAALFYLVVYALATLGIFGVIAVMTRNGIEASLENFNGAWKQSPFCCFLMALLMLSLAGIPPLGGFIGKYYLFYAIAEKASATGAFFSGYALLLILALAMSAVALYYYLKIIKTFLITEAEPEVSLSKGNGVETFLLSLLALAVITLGVWPEPLLRWIVFAFSN